MKRVPALIPFLIFVSVLFIGILVFAYVETKKANPQMIEVSTWRTPRQASTRVSTRQTRVSAPQNV